MIRFKKDEQFKTLVQKVFVKHRNQFGYRRIKQFLQIECNINASINKVKRCMHKFGIRAEYVKQMIRHQSRLSKLRQNKRYKTVDLVKRRFNQFTAKNQCWFIDVSVHAYKNRHFYQSTIYDAYTHQIVDFKLSWRNNNNLTILNLRDAIAREKPKNCIIHSDNGSVYFSDKFFEICKNANLHISKGKAYTCADNVIIEGFHSLLKKGTIHNHKYKSIEEYWDDVNGWNEWYVSYRNTLLSKIPDFSK